jgi:hypothetical protein
MNLTEVISQLNDLPDTFKRPGTIYAQLTQSFATGLTRYTDATDEIGNESTSFSEARYGWLDVWGLLFGITRNSGEADYSYSLRVEQVLMAWVGTLPAIANWAEVIYQTTVTIAENFPAPGYVIQLPGSLTIAQVDAFVASLNRIRPAGVPFQVGMQSSGLYLDTINYCGAARVTGAYLTNALTYVPLAIGPITINAVPLLPSLYLTDPTLNPSMA